MQLQRSIIPITDNAALTILEESVKLVPGAQNPQGQAHFGHSNPITIQCPLGEFRRKEEISAALKEDGEAFSYLAVLFAVPLVGNVTYSLHRDAEGATRVRLDVPQQLQASGLGKAVHFVIAFDKAFKPYSRSNVLRDVNPVIDEFYNRMNAETVRLMELNGSIIRQNEEYRQRLEAQADERQIRIEAEKRDYFKKVEEEYAAKAEDLKKREEALEQRKKDLDDRDNTHARRQKQEDLNRKLQQYQQGFTLTRDTSKKRWPVTGGFVAGLVALGVLVGVNTWASLQPSESGAPFWWQPLRVVGYTAGFIGLLIYFIRWQDRWAQTHADEEFRLKRLELDGVRAGWLVEVLLEWQRENKTEIPTALVQRLGAGLFEQSAGRPDATHPVEDVLAALLGNSSSLQFDFPGGKASLDRKGIERAKAAGA